MPKTNGMDVLGWDVTFELNEVTRQQAVDIQPHFQRIPHGAMSKRAVEQGDIYIFELVAKAA